MKVMETPLSNCEGLFEDLDKDGVSEFVACDEMFAFVLCNPARPPLVQVVLQYQPGKGYVPASPRFASIYTNNIATHRKLAEEAKPGGWDNTTKCSVLPLVLDYLYSGQPAQAWSELDRLYKYPDKQLFWAEIVRAASDSPLYTPDGPLPTVSLPRYYMLQLATACAPPAQPTIGLLTEGQKVCNPGVLRRDTGWLKERLQEIDLLATEETLTLAPEGCTTDCRLDVIESPGSRQVGSIELDTTVGFPGVVYRVNADGSRSARWRLRGDLTWERVSL
jgi:hypothetical protein